MEILKLKNVVKIYKMAGGGTFEALKNINATFSAGELVSIGVNREVENPH